MQSAPFLLVLANALAVTVLVLSGAPAVAAGEDGGVVLGGRHVDPGPFLVVLAVVDAPATVGTVMLAEAWEILALDAPGAWESFLALAAFLLLSSIQWLVIGSSLAQARRHRRGATPRVSA